jgi:hypothetical protein
LVACVLNCHNNSINNVGHFFLVLMAYIELHQSA